MPPLVTALNHTVYSQPSAQARSKDTRSAKRKVLCLQMASFEPLFQRISTPRDGFYPFPFPPMSNYLPKNRKPIGISALVIAAHTSDKM